ncbi:YcbK family protein [Amphritea sp.]|uniref:YcbK family protein n=1 Tax=Amphritea sp. TaxID=1872502 RepID=UPI0025C2FB9B|nr:YcbK family protein [Amphritea sp.]
MTKLRHPRRQFLRNFGLLSAGAALSPKAFASTIPSHKALSLPAEMSLAFNNLHTGETLNTTFFCEGEFVTDSLQAISYLLRDHRNDQVGEMSPQLMVLLHNLQRRMEVNKPFEVISGYRSPETNAMLSQKSRKVAKKSLHMQGKAIDVRMPGISLTDLHRAARNEKQGGVGLYSRSSFVHIDTGRPRSWGS